jgi:hypothetical protein
MGDTVAECSAVKNGEQKIAAALHKASSCVSSAAENEGLKQLRQSAPVFIEKVTQKADSMIIAATQKIAFPLKVSCAGLGFVAVMLLGSMLLRNQ